MSDELNIIDLIKVEWSYDDNDVVGVFGGKEIRRHQFIANQARKMICVNKCNLADEWIQEVVYKDDKEVPVDIIGGKVKALKAFIPELEENGDIKTRRYKYTGSLTVLDAEGTEIITVFRHGEYYCGYTKDIVYVSLDNKIQDSFIMNYSYSDSKYICNKNIFIAVGRCIEILNGRNN